MSPTEYSQAMDVMDKARRQFALVFRDVDVLITSSFPTQPQLRSEPRAPRGSASVSERLMAAANLAGIPGVSLPAGSVRNTCPNSSAAVRRFRRHTMRLRAVSSLPHRALSSSALPVLGAGILLATLGGTCRWNRRRKRALAGFAVLGR